MFGFFFRNGYKMAKTACVTITSAAAGAAGAGFGVLAGLSCKAAKLALELASSYNCTTSGVPCPGRGEGAFEVNCGNTYDYNNLMQAADQAKKLDGTDAYFIVGGAAVAAVIGTGVWLYIKGKKYWATPLSEQEVVVVQNAPTVKLSTSPHSLVRSLSKENESKQQSLAFEVESEETESKKDVAPKSYGSLNS